MPPDAKEDALLEPICRALCAAACLDPDERVPEKWTDVADDTTPPRWRGFRRQAELFLAGLGGYRILPETPSDAQLEAVARAILSTEEGQLMMICHGPAPCMPTPCSCTRNIYPVARAAYTAIIAQREG